MAKNGRKIVAIFLCLIITLSAFSLFGIKTQAASPIGVYDGVAPSVLTSAVDDIEDDFNLGVSEWTADKGTLECVSEMMRAPYSPYEGSHSLMINVGSYTAGEKITLKKTVGVLTETSYYHYIATAMYIPKEASGATVTMKLVGSRGSVTDTKSIDAGKWQTVFFKTDAVNRGTALRIEFTVTADSSCDMYMLLDTVGGCWGPSDDKVAKYTSAGFTPNGCTLEYGKDMTVTLSGEGQYIEAKSVADTSFGDGIGLRVNMINHTTCRSLTLKYKTDGSLGYDREITVEIPDSDREVTLMFKIPEEKITAFMLCFGGAPIGDIEILSIGPSPCFEEITGVGKITECRIARDLKNVSVKGNIDLTDEAWDGKVMLYALTPNEDNSNIALQREPLAEARVHGTEFSFSVPLDANGLFKKYIVAVKTEDGLNVICEPSHINNPELLASERTSLPESKKGIRPLPDNYVLYGIGQTALDIDLGKLFASSGESAVLHTVGSVTESFSKEYLDSLDAKMREYEREGIKVRFVYKLGSGIGKIAHPDAVGENAALNTKTEEGINALRAVTDLLVRRYGSSGGEMDNLVGIVIGASVNEAYENYNLGCVTLDEFARQYSIAVRTVYNASVSVTSGFETSIGLGGSWNGDITVGQKGSFDARSALEAISDCLTAGGDINWKLAYDITPERGKYAYKELAPDLGAGAEKITAANLETLTEFFSIPSFLYNGASRSVLLIGNEERKAVSSSEEKSLTADYIYTFLRISDRSMKNISGYIPSHSADYEEVLKYVGTDIFVSKSEFASDLIGKERFDALLLSGSVTDRTYTEAKGGNTFPDTVKGGSTIFNLKKPNMLNPSLNCLTAESGVSYGNRSDWGRIRFGEADGKALRGFFLSSPYPLDLSSAPYISFDLIVSSLPEGVDTVMVTVALYSNNNVAVASTAVSVDGENRVVCDMSGFTHLSSCDRIGIYITGEKGESIGEPMILVSSVRAYSETLSGKELKDAIHAYAGENDTVSVYTVINLVIVAVLSIAILTFRIVLRNKRTAKNRR